MTDHIRAESSNAIETGLGNPVSSLATNSTGKPAGPVNNFNYSAAERGWASALLPFFSSCAMTAWLIERTPPKLEMKAGVLCRRIMANH